MDGIFNINKPYGLTSFDVVARVRRASGERKTGHGGTLDPAATGVLPVLIGQGTRVIEFMSDTTKTYRAEIELGTETDTYDALGKVTYRIDASRISYERLNEELGSFHGRIEQVPPMYSALKHHGKPLYKLAREGMTIELKSRPVEIFRLELQDWEPPVLTLEVECGKGTYIRSLAHDLGKVLGCGGHLKSLVRTRCGIFDIKDSVSLQKLEEALNNGETQEFLKPMDIALSGLKAMMVSDEAIIKMGKGQPIIPEGLMENICDSGTVAEVNGFTNGQLCRAYSRDNRFIGILRFDTSEMRWCPKKVLLREPFGFRPKIESGLDSLPIIGL